MARTLRSDKVLFFAALALVCTSVIMVVSASVAREPLARASLRQLAYAVGGLIAMFALMRTDYHHLRRPTVIWTLLGVTTAGLLGVFLFKDLNGAHRWIHLPVPGLPVSLQPSELAKLAAIVFAAAVLERRMHRINDVRYSLLPIGLVTGVLAFLIVKEPDLGTSMVVVLAVLTMAFAAGLSWRYLCGVLLLMLPVLTYYILTHAERTNRVLAFLRPDEVNKLGDGWQLYQSLIALGSGGIFGLGLGEGWQKLFFLPEPQNDFIFAVIGEEFGLVGTTLVVACFAVVAWRGLRAALLAPDRFGTLVGVGLTMMIGMQAFINMSVVTGLAPTKGIPLPFVSAGGSSLLVNLLAMGILLNISQQASPAAAATVDAPS
jgi:cell division protein FtsW